MLLMDIKSFIVYYHLEVLYDDGHFGDFSYGEHVAIISCPFTEIQKMMVDYITKTFPKDNFFPVIKKVEASGIYVV